MIPLFPLLGAAVAVLGARRLKIQAHVPVVVGIALAFLFSLGHARLGRARPEVDVMSWLTATDFQIPIELRVDGLSSMMLSMVTFVSGLVAVFAAGYMDGDEGYPRFFALIGLFVFSMTGLVLSNNYVLTYVFWEGVGACSYLLIGYWHSRPSAAAAAMKAFMVNRVGDVGFAIAIFLLWSIVPGHDLSYDNVFKSGNTACHAARRDLLDLAAAVLGRDGQECSDPALRLAPRRDGRPHAGLGADPRRDDGDGRRLPDRALDADDRPGSGGPVADRHRSAVPRPCSRRRSP